MGESEDRGYRGPIRVHLADSVVEVDGQLHGFFQPIDGSYHWYGRLSPDERLSTRVAERGRSAIEISVGDGSRTPARLGERNPWGGHRITGTGAPPYAPPADRSLVAASVQPIRASFRIGD